MTKLTKVPKEGIDSDDYLVKARLILKAVRKRLITLASADAKALFQIRRYVYKNLMYDERSSPMQRKALKLKKRIEQKEKCASCKGMLPESGAVLDRFDAIKGYTFENTRLLCRECDTAIQVKRGFK